MAKASKEEARYSLHGTEEEHCGVCTMFRRPGLCTSVQGRVNADIGICKYFEKRG